MVVSGCAHAGIVNTVNHAKAVTGVNQVYAVMGGFHLSATDMDTVIKPTTEALKSLKPRYVIPTHCTGRKAVNHMEQELGEAFILNMSGTTLTFSE